MRNSRSYLLREARSILYRRQRGRRVDFEQASKPPQYMMYFAGASAEGDSVETSAICVILSLYDDVGGRT
jgi:hypothetical protein